MRALARHDGPCIAGPASGVQHDSQGLALRRPGGVRRALGLCVLALGTLAGSGCAGSRTMMDAYVPAHCNEAAAPFRTFTLRTEQMPGFIDPVVRNALAGSLLRTGLELVPDASVADVTMVARFSMIDIDTPAGSGTDSASAARDAYGDHLAAGEVTRFIAHVELALQDNRDGRRIWRGAMDRVHAIVGGETFHDDRAVLMISQTLDGMLAGLRTSCGGSS